MHTCPALPKAGQRGREVAGGAHGAAKDRLHWCACQSRHSGGGPLQHPLWILAHQAMLGSNSIL